MTDSFFFSTFDLVPAATQIVDEHEFPGNQNYGGAAQSRRVAVAPPGNRTRHRNYRAGSLLRPPASDSTRFALRRTYHRPRLISGPRPETRRSAGAAAQPAGRASSHKNSPQRKV